jgi:hypothetical protein
MKMKRAAKLKIKEHGQSRLDERGIFRVQKAERVRLRGIELGVLQKGQISLDARPVRLPLKRFIELLQQRLSVDRGARGE